MKLTCRKNWLLFVCLLASFMSFSQTEIDIKGSDSILIQIRTDTIRKWVHTSVALKDTTYKDSFQLAKKKLGALRDSAGFYKKFLAHIKTDSLKRRLTDTVKKFLAIDGHFRINLIDTTSSPATASATPTHPATSFQPAEKDWLETLTDSVPLLSIFLALIAGIITLAILLWKKGPKQAAATVLPDSLLKIYPEVKRNKELEVTVRKIGEIHMAMEQELETLKINNESANKLIKELEEKKEVLNTELTAAKQALKEKQDEIANSDKANESFKGWADKVLDKYFRDLAIMLEKNQIKDEQEIYRLILTRLITFSMHSASILKKQIKDATELDSLNLQLLDGDEPRPIGVITENTQFGHADPLAYYIYHLLKRHQVEGLHDVFVKGYKIGT
jgi:hypothetical protein